MRSSSPGATASAAVLSTLSTLAALTGVANAQSAGGFSLNQLDPAPAGDVFFSVPSPAAPGHLVPRFYAMFDYANRPIRLVDGDVAIVSSQTTLRLDASLALWDRALVSVDLPLLLAQAGDDPPGTDVTFTTLTAPQLGDLRLGARLRLLGDDAGPIQLGLSGYLYVPTGSRTQYTSDGKSSGVLQANLGGRVGANIGLAWSASCGVELGGANSPQTFTFGGAVGLLLGGDLLQIGPEIHGASPLDGALILSNSAATRTEADVNAELLFGAKLRVLGGLTFGAAVGPGLFHAVGTPSFQGVTLIGWAPLPAPPSSAPPKQVVAAGDKDDDGIRDDIDACPDVKGDPSPDPAKDGCPPSDRDGDMILDTEDACPTTAGVRNGDPLKNGCPIDSDNDGFHDIIDACPSTPGVGSDDPKKVGCPADKDEDGILDADDACPTAAGTPSQDPKKNGCPDDLDGDGVLNEADACPNERGVPDSNPRLNGCPRFVHLTGDEIVTSEPVQFITYGKNRRETVAPVSDALLGEVRDVIIRNPDIELIEVQGHTDDIGTADYNVLLSQERAEAVLEWLVAAGVPRNKLVAKGYGFQQPLGDNRVKTGRQQNRRVQFMIVQRKKP